MRFHTVHLPLTTILLAASLAAQVTLEPRVASETLPSGGVMQIKVDITSPHPIITGGAALDMPPDFDDLFGVSAFSPAGDVYGAAFLRGRTFVANLVSPLASLGTQLDYPFLAIAAHIQPGLATGTQIPINFNSLSLFNAPGGTLYSYLVKNGVLTIGGSISVTNVIPGGGVLPAGTTVRVLGTGFTANTQLTPGTLQISNFRYVSATELRFEMAQAGNMTAQRLKVKNPADNHEVTYFSYLRAVPVGASVTALLNATHPLFADASTFTSAVLTAPVTNGFFAVALQNATLTQTSVLLQLFAAGGAALGNASVVLPAGSRWSRTLAELFGSAPAAGSTVRITSSVALQVLGLSGDDSAVNVTAFPATVGPPPGAVTLSATPASLSFTTSGTQQVTLTSSAGVTAFAAQSDQSWLSITGANGQTPATLSVSVNATGLAAGQYNGTISVDTLAIPVALTVAAAGGGGGPVSGTGLRFVPVSPCRLVDTRINPGTFGSPALGGGTSRSFPLPQHPNCAIPAGALAYSLNVTVVPHGRLDYLTIWPTGVAQPLVSTLNSADGRIKANAALVPAGTNGAVSVFVTNETDLVMDINGYFVDSASALAFYPLPPCRIADTRNPDAALGGGATRTFSVIASNCGVPASAQAYSLNATVVPSGPLGFLTLWPTGQGQPFVSTLNAPTGAVVANAAIVPAGSNGSINAYATNQTHLVLDINGYFAPPGFANAQRFFPATPCRLADTRNGAGEFGGPSLAPGQSRDFRLPLTACGVPSGTGAYSLNATVVPQSTLGYLTLWPSGAAQPFVSTLNAIGDSVVANAAIVPAGSAGGVSSFATDTTHLVLDLNGYFAP